MGPARVATSERNGTRRRDDRTQAFNHVNIVQCKMAIPDRAFDQVFLDRRTRNFAAIDLARISTRMISISIPDSIVFHELAHFLFSILLVPAL